MEAAIFSKERPTVGSILSLTFKLYGANFLAITLIGVLAFVPLVLFSIGAASLQTNPGSGAVLVLVGAFALVVTVPAGYAAAIHAVFQAALGVPIDIGRSIGVGFRKLPRAIGVMFLTTLAVLLGTLALIIPGIIAFFAFLLAIPVVTVEDVGVIDAMRRSSRLIEGFRGTAIGINFVLGVLNVGVSLLVALLSAMVGGAESLGGIVLNVVLSAVSGGIGIVAYALIYFAIRAFKESIGVDAVAAVFE